MSNVAREMAKRTRTLPTERETDSQAADTIRAQSNHDIERTPISKSKTVRDGAKSNTLN